MYFFSEEGVNPVMLGQYLKELSVHEEIEKSLKSCSQKKNGRCSDSNNSSALSQANSSTGGRKHSKLMKINNDFSGHLKMNSDEMMFK